MKQYTIYTCEFCDYESKDYEDMRKHEASHFGLTVKEKESYDSLKRLVKYLVSALSDDKIVDCIRDNYKKALLIAIEDLIDFEKEYNLDTVINEIVPNNILINNDVIIEDKYVIVNDQGKYFTYNMHGHPMFIDDVKYCKKCKSKESAEEFLNSDYVQFIFEDEMRNCHIDCIKMKTTTLYTR